MLDKHLSLVPSLSLNLELIIVKDDQCDNGSGSDYFRDDNVHLLECGNLRSRYWLENYDIHHGLDWNQRSWGQGIIRIAILSEFFSTDLSKTYGEIEHLFGWFKILLIVALSLFSLAIDSGGEYPFPISLKCVVSQYRSKRKSQGAVHRHGM